MRIDYLSFYQKYVKDLKPDGNRYLGWCPFHSDEGTRRKGFSLNITNGLWYCHGSCNTGGNVFTFCEKMNISPIKAPGYDKNYRYYQYRTGIKKKHQTEKDNFFWVESPRTDNTPYNMEVIEEVRESKRRLWICEGERDTETMHSVGELAIGIPSATDLEGIEKIDFSEIEKIILAFNNDKAGKRATEKVLQLTPWADVIKWPKEKVDGYNITDCYNEDAQNFLSALDLWLERQEEPHLAIYLQKKLDVSQSRDLNTPLGYSLTKFKNMQYNLDGIQPGLYIVGADTGMGKTSFVVNLFWDIINTNKDLTGIYFSLDDNKGSIINRFLAIQSTIPINKIQKRINNEKELTRLKKAYSKLTELSIKHRICIFDQSDVTHIKDVEFCIKRNLRRKLFVVVDGLFNLESEEKTEEVPHVFNVERVSALKRLVDLYRIPLICTIGLRKNSQGVTAKKPTLDDIMESGKFKYNANLIILLYPNSAEAFENNDEPLLNMKYVKNKLSSYRGTDKLRFKRLYSIMEEGRGKRS